MTLWLNTTLSGNHNLPGPKVGLQYRHLLEKGPVEDELPAQEVQTQALRTAHFYFGIIQSVLFTSITVWFGSSTKRDRNRSQQAVRSAENIKACAPFWTAGLCTHPVRKNHCRCISPQTQPCPSPLEWARQSYLPQNHQTPASSSCSLEWTHTQSYCPITSISLSVVFLFIFISTVYTFVNTFIFEHSS